MREPTIMAETPDFDREDDTADLIEGVPTVVEEYADDLEYERSLWGADDYNLWEDEQVFQDGVLEREDY